MYFVNGDVLKHNPTQPVDMSVNVNGPGLNVKQAVNVALRVAYSGPTAAGIFKLQGSNDPTDSPVNWDDITGTTSTVAGAGSSFWNVSNIGFSWIRWIYVRTSGTGTITEASITAKGFN